MPNDNSFVSGVRATVEARDTAAPPKIIFAFSGLNEPIHLWEQLSELGWTIPDRPAAPDAAIDWNTPGTNVDLKVLPYLVEDFQIRPQDWPKTEVAKRSLDTINVLRRLGVDLQIPISYLDFLRRTQVAQMERSEIRSSEATLQPIHVPNTLFLSKQPWAVLIDEPTIEMFQTASSPNQPTWVWSESARPVGELCSSNEERTQLLSSVDMGWELLSRTEPPEALEGRDRILRFLVRDMRDGTGMLRRLQAEVGDQCASILMRPIRATGAVENCLLIVAAVPSERFAEIGQKMITEFPDAIGRGKRYSSASPVSSGPEN